MITHPTHYKTPNLNNNVHPPSIQNSIKRKKHQLHYTSLLQIQSALATNNAPALTRRSTQNAYYNGITLQSLEKACLRHPENPVYREEILTEEIRIALAQDNTPEALRLVSLFPPSRAPHIKTIEKHLNLS